MKFTIETGTLAAALKVASVAMVGGMQLPILGNIKIEATDDQLILSSTNLDLYVIQKVPAKITEAGVTTIAFNILSALVGRMHSTMVSITIKDKIATFKSGEVTALLETLDPAEFPPPLKRDRESAVEIDAQDILKPFAILAHAMHADTSRYLLMGINLFPTTGGTDFAATNGHRLVIYHGVKLTDENVNARYLIETLNVLESNEVRIQCMNADSPVMIEEGPVVAVINQLLAVT